MWVVHALYDVERHLPEAAVLRKAAFLTVNTSR